MMRMVPAPSPLDFKRQVVEIIVAGPGRSKKDFAMFPVYCPAEDIFDGVIRFGIDEVKTGFVKGLVMPPPFQVQVHNLPIAGNPYPGPVIPG